MKKEIGNSVFNAMTIGLNQEGITMCNVMPYLRREYSKLSSKKRKETDIKEFVKNELMYQYWSRCEYEIVIREWPIGNQEYKIDVYDQCMNNIDLIVGLLKKDFGIKENKHDSSPNKDEAKEKPIKNK